MKEMRKIIPKSCDYIIDNQLLISAGFPVHSGDMCISVLV